MSFCNRRRVVGLFSVVLAFSGFAAGQEITLEIRDFLTAPMTGAAQPAGDIDQPGFRDTAAGLSTLLARINRFREEPGARGRFFLVDMNGPLYIFDKKSAKFDVYLNFNGKPGKGGLFHRMTADGGLSSGYVGIELDPDYLRNGKFYTVHIEDPQNSESAMPDNSGFPGLKLQGYTLSEPIKTAGPLQMREGVLIEWTDTNTEDTVFQGTAREVLRVQLNRSIHPLGDIVFNPTARRGDPEWGVMYLSCGDGGSGESNDAVMRKNPQRLDNMVGKIHRIIPDLSLHADSSTVSGNGRYRIPNDNPFVKTEGARKEIWAYGIRNPNRLTFDVDPDSGQAHLLATVVGLNTWETVMLVRKGANYGFSLREGNELLNTNNRTGALPEDDRIPVQIDDTKTDGMVKPTYPVISYGHVPAGGDSVTVGFVYRGKAIPALQGKYIFGDITTGHVWWADFKEMLAADDGDPKTMAATHEVRILWHRPDGSSELYPTMSPIVFSGYRARGGASPKLPTGARVAGGRADIRFATDAAGELYILSKGDGMIRAVVGATAK